MVDPITGAVLGYLGKTAIEMGVGAAMGAAWHGVVSLWNRKKKTQNEMMEFDYEPEPLPTKYDLQPYSEPTPEDTIARPYINPTQIIDNRPDILCERYDVPKGTNIYKFPFKESVSKRTKRRWRKYH